jgi:hypothetical protein
MVPKDFFYCATHWRCRFSGPQHPKFSSFVEIESIAAYLQNGSIPLYKIANCCFRIRSFQG